MSRRAEPRAAPAAPSRRARRAPPPSRAVHYRLAVLWGDTLLDLVSVQAGRPTTHRLRSGACLHASLGRAAEPGDPLLIRIDDEAQALLPGEAHDLACGHRLIVVADEGAPRATGPLSIDSRLFHAVMVSAAVQVCLVSAMVLAPERVTGGQPGGGVRIGDLARFIHVTGGAAERAGQATFAAPGRLPDEAERIPELKPAAGAPTAVARGGRSGPTLQEALDAMVRAVNRGSDGVELREALGDLARATARAPDIGAGFGGLLPRTLLEPGAGSGVVGLGPSQMHEALRAHRQRLDERLRLPEKRNIPIPLTEPIGPVTRADVDGTVDVLQEGGADLDPVVRDHLTRAVRDRANAIRHCYETWGLTSDPRREGRLVLELTLLPNGFVADPATTTSASLEPVASCARRMVADWYLGDGLVSAPTRLAFPFVLKPRRTEEAGARSHRVDFTGGFTGGLADPARN